MLLPSVIYLGLFIAFLFLPGFFVTLILGIKKFRFLLSFALSYALLVLTRLPFEYYAQPIARWQWCVILEWVILAVLAVVKTLIDRNFKTSNVQRSTSNAQQQTNGFGFNVESWMVSVQSFSRRRPALIRRLLIPRLIVPLVLAVVICGYFVYAGPYLEIPSDAWEHVRRFKWFETGAIEEGLFASGFSLVNILTHRLRWYFIHAWLCHLAGLPIMDSLPVLSCVNALVFLLAIYYFGLFLFAGLRVSTFKKMIMAALASLFAAATLGNMVFAYIRYYALAPTILNYVLFLAATALIITWLRSDRWSGYALWIVPILIIVTSMIHIQETLFIFFITLALSLVACIRIFWRKIISASELMDQPCGATIKPIREWKSITLALVLLLVFFSGFILIRQYKPGAWISQNMIMPHQPLPVDSVNFIFRNLLISPPQNPWLRLAVYQLFVFYQVVGCWGLFVYLLVLLMIRHSLKIPYLMAGMIIVPLLTVFNPFMIDLIVRMNQSAALYRFIYLIPLPFAGSYLFVHFWDKAHEGWRHRRAAPAEPVAPIRPQRPWLNFAGCGLVLIGLIGLIFPINTACIYAPYSKIYTLRKIPTGNDYRLYEDLEKIIAQYENKVILSDGWTAGFLWFFSPKNTYGWLKWFSSLNPEKEQPDPYTWENLRNRGIIIINRRDGAPSITGKIAKHWPEDALKISRLYSPEAQNYLEAHPEKFHKIWFRNQIAVYAVH